jgi:WD40 repeat protein
MLTIVSKGGPTPLKSIDTPMRIQFAGGSLMCGCRFAGLAFAVGFVALGTGCGTSQDKPASNAAPAVATKPNGPHSNPAPSAGGAATTSVPLDKPETVAAAATPVDAIARLLAAAKSGDIRRLAATLAPPMDSLVLEQDQVRTDILVAHEKLNHELDAAFGPRTDQSKRPFSIEFAEEVLAGLSANPLVNASPVERAALDMKVVDQHEEPGRVLLTVELTMLGKNKPIPMKWAAIKVGQAWKVVPGTWKADEMRAEIARTRTLLESYRTAAREVREGQYKSRQQVDSVLVWALAVTRPELFMMMSPPRELTEIFPQPPDPTSPPDSLRIEIHVDPAPPNQTARAALRSLRGEPLQWDGPLDRLLPKLTELHKNLAGRSQPSWVVTLEPHPSAATLDVLRVLIDAGFDYRRVVFAGKEPQVRELERQLSGRLRLFAIRIPGPKSGGSISGTEASRIRDEGKGTDDKLTPEPSTQMELNAAPELPAKEMTVPGVEAVSPSLAPETTKGSPQLSSGPLVPPSAPGTHKELKGLLPSPDGGTGTGGFFPSANGKTFGVNLGPAHVTRLREARSFDAGVSAVKWLSFSPDGKWIAASGFEERVNIWDASTNRLVRSLAVPLSPMACQFCPTDKNYFACALRQIGKVQLWLVAESKVVREFKVADPTAIAFRPDGKQLACAASDGTVQTWDTHSGALLSTVRPLGGRPIDGLAFRADGLRIATFGGLNITIGIWDPESPGRVETFASNLPSIGQIVFSPDGRSVAAASTATIRVWHLGRGGATAPADYNFAAPTGARGGFSHSSCAFSPNGDWLAGGTEREVAIWRTARTKPVVSLADAHSQARGPIAWSPDGKRLLSAGPGPIVKIWNVE